MLTSLLTPTYPPPNFFSTSLTQQHTPHDNYNPHQPSPLRTSRHANLMPKSSVTTSTPPQKPLISRFPSSSSSSKAPSLSNPATHLSRLVSVNRASRKTAHRERAADRRADAYLDERHDQVSRIEWVREQRRWEERMKRWGMREGVYEEEQEEDGDMMAQPGSGQTVQQQQEEMPMPTEEEIDALLDLLASDRTAGNGQVWGAEVETGHRGEDRHTFSDETYNIPSRRTSQVYSSDEEDYDQLFMEVINSSQAEQEGSREGQLSEAMDTS